ncbi:hypothetical protein ACFW04_014490 [Cataglyphis niger]
MVCNSSTRQHLSFAELALQKFIYRSEALYLVQHLILTICFGYLESFSAFPYENNMSIFRKYCRKPGVPLQQFFNRMAEIKVHGTSNNQDVDLSIHISMLRNNDNNCIQYRKIKFNNILLGIDIRDNCILRDGSICIVFNIAVDNNFFRLCIKKFLEIHDLYDIDMISFVFQIYKCATLNSEIFYVHSDQVHAKCYRILFSIVHRRIIATMMEKIIWKHCNILSLLLGNFWRLFGTCTKVVISKGGALFRYMYQQLFH